jgi:hypothetical protein
MMICDCWCGFTGIENQKEIREGGHLSKAEYRISKKKGTDMKREAALYKDPVKHLDYTGQPDWKREIEYMKPKGHSKAEHIFLHSETAVRVPQSGVLRIDEKHGAGVYAFCGREPVEMGMAAEAV